MVDQPHDANGRPLRVGQRVNILDFRCLHWMYTADGVSLIGQEREVRQLAEGTVCVDDGSPHGSWLAPRFLRIVAHRRRGLAGLVHCYRAENT